MAGIVIEILGRTTQFQRELDSAVAATAKANTSFAKMAKVAGIAGLALGGVLAIGLEKSVKAAMAAETSTARMNTAFHNAGVSAKAFTGPIEKAEAASRKLGFTNLDVRNSLGSLVVATKDGGAAIKDLSVAIDVARFKHLDLEAATKTLTMAMAGSKRALTALGVPLIAVTDHMDALKRSGMDLSTVEGEAAKKHAQLLDKMATGQAILKETENRVHGVGAAFADTAAGKMQEFHAQIENLQESLGKGLLPAITTIVGKLADLAAWFGAHPDIAKAVVISLFGLAAALTAAWVQAFILENVFTFGIPAAIVIAGAAIYLLITHFQAVGDWIKSHAYILFVLPVVGQMIALGILIATHWGAIKATVVGAMNAVSGVIEGAWNSAVGVVRSASSAITGAVSTMVGTVRGLINDLVAIWNTLRNAAAKAIKFVLDTSVLNTALGLIHDVQSAWDALRHAASSVIHFVTQQSGTGGIRPPPPHRASGGRVMAGMAYTVGELGPETFVPGSSGSIIPNGGGAVYNFSFPNYVGSKQEMVEMVRSELYRISDRNGGLRFG